MMEKGNKEIVQKISFIKGTVFALMVIWSLFIVSLFYYNYKNMKQWVYKLAETEAWASYNKDVVYRKWAAGHGGVYVPPTEKTPPSPYLSHIPDRDVITTKGKKLTLINPAYMTRQVHELAQQEYKAKGHITSLNPIRPGNKPDKWEEKTLKLFEKGLKEKSEIITNEKGETVLRGMKPLTVEERCLKCHQYQGYKVGDIRGGLSVEVPMEPYNNILKKHLVNEATVFLVVWILGILSIIIVAILYIKNIKVLQANSIKQYALEKQLLQAQKMEAVGQLAGGIAHDFNNLLGIIIGFADLALDELDIDSPLYKYSQNILKTGERAKALVKQINIFSQQKNSKKEVIDINILIDDFLKLLKRTIGEHIAIDFKKGGDPFKIVGDKIQIEQVIMNLCVNARDAMPNGGNIVIESEYKLIDKEFCQTHPWATPGEYIAIKVSDTGMGIDKDIMSRIYDPFFTTKEVGKGTGLGLSVVFGIMQKHSGFINVYSVVGHGTIFSIYFPIASNELFKQITVSIDKDKENRNIGGTILVAEDEELLRDMLQNILKSAGFKILLAKNGEEAVEVFKKHSNEINMVLFDLMMPIMGGYKAYNNISKIKKGVPVLFASGYSSEAISSELFNAKEYEIIWKPYSRDELLDKVYEILAAVKNGNA